MSKGDAPVWMRLSRNVIVLGLISFITDTASEMIVPLIPIFLTRYLKAGTSELGVIAGVADSLSSFLRLWSGWLSDRLRRRKVLIVLGYGISSVVRPLMGLATSWWHILAVRAADRTAKGVRLAPRDALLADSSDEPVRGRAFGFQQMADNLGAAVGPLIAWALLWTESESTFRTIFLLAVIPAALVLPLGSFGIVEKPPAGGAAPVRLSLAPFDARFRLYLMAALLFNAAVVSEFFLVLPLKKAGFSDREVLLVWSGFMVVRSLSAMAGGLLSDRFGRRRTIFAGWALFAAGWAAFAWAPAGWTLLPLAAYGVFNGLSLGPQRAYVADLVPERLRGTAYGVYYCTMGIAALGGNAAFGWASAEIGMKWAFLGGAVLAGIGIAVLAAVKRGPAAPVRA